MNPQHNQVQNDIISTSILGNHLNLRLLGTNTIYEAESVNMCPSAKIDNYKSNFARCGLNCCCPIIN